MRKARFDERYFEHGIHYGRGGGYGSLEIEARVSMEYLDLLRYAKEIFHFDFLNGKDKRALDVGCAYGYGLGVLRKLGYKTHGLDRSRFGLRRAKFSRYGQTLLLASAEFPPFRREFDLIICTNLLEHVRRPEAVVRALYKCLRMGGFMLASTPSRFSLFRLMPYQDETHINVQSPAYWKTIFGAFEWTRLVTTTLQWIPFSWLLLHRIVTVSLPVFGDTVVVIGQK